MGRQPTRAQFIKGSKVEIWLHFISKWDIDDSQLRLLVVPKSMRDLSPVGVLVITTGADSTRLANIEASPFVTPYGAIGNRFFLPVDGELVPKLTSDEMDAIGGDDIFHIWHPANGLIGVSEDDLQNVSDILGIPPESFSDWSFSKPDLNYNTRIVSISSIEPPSADSIIETGKEDIGSKSDEVKIPPSGSKVDMSASERTSSGFSSAIANAILWGTSKTPTNANRRTWINDLEDWAKQKLRDISDKIEERRNKELKRLLDMLKDDPDRGLKFAMPMSPDSNVRGISPEATDQLVSRNPKFSLNRSGGVADYWNVPYQIRQELIRNYRELAEREIKLGRFRRAAYIYSELLGDSRLAAKALETGKYWREAAVLYRERLKSNDEAARCLREGGFWTEVIELYDELNRHEDAGDVLKQLNQVESANKRFTKAADEARAIEDFVKAATIEEKKIEDTELALKSLEQGWVKIQSVRCLDQMLRIFSESGQHSESRDWIGHCTDRDLDRLKDCSRTIWKSLVGLLAKTSQSYPDPLTRKIAKDTSFRFVSSLLESSYDQNLSGVLAELGATEPKDRLLSKDLRRCLIKKDEDPDGGELELLPYNAVRSRRMEIKKVSGFSTMVRGKVINAVGIKNSLLLVSDHEQRLTVERIGWDESIRFNPLVFRYELHHFSEDPIVELKPSPDGMVGMILPNGNLEPVVAEFAETDLTPRLKLGRPSVVAEKAYGLETYSYGAWGYVAPFDGNWIVQVSDNSNPSMLTKVIEGGQGMPCPTPMYSSGRRLYVGAGKQVHVIDGNRRSADSVIDFEHVVVDVVGSVRGTRSRIAICLGYGVEVVFGGFDSAITSRICKTMVNPKAVFLRSGHLAIGSGRDVQIYSTKQRELVLVGELVVPPILTLTRSKTSNHLAIVHEDGSIGVYNVPTH